MRELRHCEAPFGAGQVEGAIAQAKKRGDNTPTYFGFDYDTKKAVLYRLLIPCLDEVLSNELAQTGEEDGFELFRQLVRKLDPPKADVAFDLKSDIEGLG